VLDDANQLMSRGGDSLRCAKPPLHLLIELAEIILVLECARLGCFRPIRLTVRSRFARSQFFPAGRVSAIIALTKKTVRFLR